MKGLILHPMRLRAALDGRLKVMRVPVVPQPPCSLSRLENGKWTYTDCDYDWKPPYAHGEKRFVRELHAVLDYDMTLVYKIDCDDEQLKIVKEMKCDWSWTPESLSRLNVTFLNPRPERVQSVMEEEAVIWKVRPEWVWNYEVEVRR